MSTLTPEQRALLDRATIQFAAADRDLRPLLLRLLLDHGPYAVMAVIGEQIRRILTAAEVAPQERETLRLLFCFGYFTAPEGEPVSPALEPVTPLTPIPTVPPAKGIM